MKEMGKMRVRSMRGIVIYVGDNYTALEFEEEGVIVSRSILDRTYSINDEADFDGIELSTSEAAAYRGLPCNPRWRATKIKYVKPVGNVLIKKNVEMSAKRGVVVHAEDSFKTLRFEELLVLIDDETEGGSCAYNVGDELEFDAVRLPIDKINEYWDTPRQSTWIATKVELISKAFVTPLSSTIYLPINKPDVIRIQEVTAIAPKAHSTPIDVPLDTTVNQPVNTVPKPSISGRGSIMLIRPKVFAAIRYNGWAVIAKWNVILYHCDSDDIVEFSAVKMSKEEQAQYSGIGLAAIWKATKMVFVKRTSIQEGIGQIISIDFKGEYCFLNNPNNGAEIFCTRINFKPEIDRPDTISTYFAIGDVIKYIAKEQPSFGKKSVKWKAIAATTPAFELFTLPKDRTLWSARRINHIIDEEICHNAPLDYIQNSTHSGVNGGIHQSDSRTVTNDVTNIEVFRRCLGSTLQSAIANSNCNSDASNPSICIPTSQTFPCARHIDTISNAEDMTNIQFPSNSKCSLSQDISFSGPLHTSTPNSSVDPEQRVVMERQEVDVSARTSKSQVSQRLSERPQSHNMDDANTPGAERNIVDMRNQLETTVESEAYNVYNHTCSYDEFGSRNAEQNMGGKSDEDDLSDTRHKLINDCLDVLSKLDTYPVPVAKFLSEFRFIHRTDFKDRLKPLGLQRFSQLQDHLLAQYRYFVVERNGAHDIHREIRYMDSKKFAAPTAAESTERYRVDSPDTAGGFYAPSDRNMNYGQVPVRAPGPLPLMAYAMPPQGMPPFPFGAGHPGIQMMSALYGPQFLAPSSSKFLKLQELYNIVNEECQKVGKNIAVEYLFEKVIERIEPMMLQLNSVVMADFAGVIKRAVDAGHIHASLTNGLMLPSSSDGTVASSGQGTASVLSTREVDKIQKENSSTSEILSQSATSSAAKFSDNHLSDISDGRRSITISDFGSTSSTVEEDLPRASSADDERSADSVQKDEDDRTFIPDDMNLERQRTDDLHSCQSSTAPKFVPAVVKSFVSSRANSRSCSVNTTREQNERELCERTASVTITPQRIDAADKCAQKKAGGWSFIRKENALKSEDKNIPYHSETSIYTSQEKALSTSSEQASVESAEDYTLTLTSPVSDWTEHLKFKRRGKIFIQPADRQQFEMIRDAKISCENKWKRFNNLPNLLMLLRMIEPSRPKVADWKLTLNDLRTSKILPQEAVLAKEFGITPMELLTSGFYELAASGKDDGAITLNEIILPLNFVQIQPDSVVDYVYQLFITRSELELSIRDVVYTVSDMISNAACKDPIVLESYLEYGRMNNNDRDQYIFDKILECPLLFWCDRQKMRLQLADEVFVVGSSGMFLKPLP